MKKWWNKARRHPVSALYLLGAAVLVAGMLLNFCLDAAAYKMGWIFSETISLNDTAAVTFSSLEQVAADTYTPVTGDPQIFIQPGQRIRTLRIVADYAGGAAGEKELYWHFPGGGYTSALRIWPTVCEGGWYYRLPWLAGKGIRLDPAAISEGTITFHAIIINEQPAWYTYFIPSLWQLYWLAVIPGLAGMAILLVRDAAQKHNDKHNGGRLG